MEADGEEEGQRQEHSAGGGDPHPQSGQGRQTDRELPERDQHADERGRVRRDAEEPADRAAVLQRKYRRLHRCRRAGVEVRRVRELLQSGVGEGDAEEQPEWPQ